MYTFHFRLFSLLVPHIFEPCLLAPCLSQVKQRLLSEMWMKLPWKFLLVSTLLIIIPISLGISNERALLANLRLRP